MKTLFTLKDLQAGLQNDWVDDNFVIKYIMDNVSHYNLSEENTIAIIESDGNNLLSILERINKINYIEENNCRWVLHFLLPIKKDILPIKEKNLLISEIWALFNYPKDWNDFIYYMPNDKIASDKDVYEKFLEFIEGLEKSCI